MNREPVLTKKDCVKGACRWSLMAVTTFNYDTQLAPAVVFGIGPLLRKIYPDDDEYVEALNNHFRYFNTHPWVANLVLGATLALEDKEGISAADAVQNIKVSLMGPLAGIGDTLIWTLLPTILGSIAGYMALEGNPVGTILWLLTNVFFIAVRTQLMWVGYREGTKLITKFGGKIAQITGTDGGGSSGRHGGDGENASDLPDGRGEYGAGGSAGQDPSLHDLRAHCLGPV